METCRCDAAARDILISGCVKLSQLAAERLRGCGGRGGGAGSPGAGGDCGRGGRGGRSGGASDSWQEVLSLSLQRLAGWLQQQSQLVAEMSEVADLTMEVRRLRLLGPCQVRPPVATIAPRRPDPYEQLCMGYCLAGRQFALAVEAGCAAAAAVSFRPWRAILLDMRLV